MRDAHLSQVIPHSYHCFEETVVMVGPFPHLDMQERVANEKSLTD